MLPCDRNPEREMRQRFFQREADMRLAKGTPLNEFRLGLAGQNRLKDQDGNIWYGVDIRYNIDDFQGGLVQTFEEAVEKKGYFVVSGKTPSTFLSSAQVVVNDAKNQADANKKVKRIALASRIKNPFIEIAHDLKGLVRDILGLKKRKNKKPKRQQPTFTREAALQEAKRVPLATAAKDVVDDLERFGRNQGPGPDKRLAALRSAIKSGKTSALLSATKSIVDDLERFNRTQGPGPDKRLASLKAAIARGILGGGLTEEKVPPSRDPAVVAIRDSIKFTGKTKSEFRDRPEPVWKFDITMVAKTSELPPKWFEFFSKSLHKLDWRIVRGFKKLTIHVLSKSQSEAKKELTHQIDRA